VLLAMPPEFEFNEADVLSTFVSPSAERGPLFLDWGRCWLGSRLFDIKPGATSCDATRSRNNLAALLLPTFKMNAISTSSLSSCVFASAFAFAASSASTASASAILDSSCSISASSKLVGTSSISDAKSLPVVRFTSDVALEQNDKHALKIDGADD
jgi:hypothetical protein